MPEYCARPGQKPLTPVLVQAVAYCLFQVHSRHQLAEKVRTGLEMFMVSYIEYRPPDVFSSRVSLCLSRLLRCPSHIILVLNRTYIIR
jgi:hypothetical protein